MIAPNPDAQPAQHWEDGLRYVEAAAFDDGLLCAKMGLSEQMARFIPRHLLGFWWEGYRRARQQQAP